MVVGNLATAADVLILGAGPGGYVAAIRAAQLGREVVLVDPGPPGGTCLHQGCIPLKALLTAADQAWRLPALADMGITVGETRVDLGQMQNWKNGLVERLAKGVKHLLDSHKVELVLGEGRFTAENEAHIEAEHGAKRFTFERCVIAVGAAPAPLPGLAFDGERVLTPSQALSLTELPASLAVIGSDYIAAEVATLFAKLGSQVRLLIPVEQQLLGEFDPSAGRQVQAKLKKLGVKLEAKVTDPAQAVNDEPLVVVSAGLKPRTGKLGLKEARVESDAAGFIKANDCLQTSNPAIYAVGDVTGGLPLATVAIKQAKVAAEALAGRPAQYAPQVVPQVAWTDPPVATAGLTADAAKAAGYEVVTGRFPMAANGRALTLDGAEGFVQTVAEKKSGVLLGVTIVGARAASLIGEATLALEMGATLIDLAETMHPHPGLGETLQEAAEAALGIAVHITSK